MKKTFYFVLVLCAGVLFFGSSGAFAQPISVGVKAGLPLTDAFDVASGEDREYFSDTKRYIVGPQVELRLPAGFGIEFNALYTKLEFSSVSRVAGSALNSFTDANSWEFPLLLKYKFGGPSVGVAAVRPFVDVGASFRRLSDITQIGDFITGGPREDEAVPELRDKNSTGFVIGGGLEIRALFLRISPEFRFTRWGTENFREGVAGLLSTNRNQGQFLVGFSF
ncbi:MAG: outer membrane beta-barrel protein [Bryobacteraceae bacterium]